MARPAAAAAAAGWGVSPMKLLLFTGYLVVFLEGKEELYVEESCTLSVSIKLIVW